MGQYHTIYNKTKKEYFTIGGAKLIEKAYTPECALALMLLLSNSNGRGGGDVYVERKYDEDLKPLPLKGKLAKVDAAIKEMQSLTLACLISLSLTACATTAHLEDQMQNKLTLFKNNGLVK